jgi:DNA-directed RNA polymerase specialized sigma24 family protein
VDFALALPVSRHRCNHFTAELGHRLKLSAASRRDAPASTASITRSRKSSEYGFGIAWTPKGRISAVRLVPRHALGNPFDSTQPENALASFRSRVLSIGSSRRTNVESSQRSAILPYLRRYARALTGSQTSGDEYVAATLESLIKDPQPLDSEDSLRVTLYRLFSTIWSSIAVNKLVDPVGSVTPAERNLGRLTAKPRQAFILLSVEGFSEEEAARILDVDGPTLSNLMEESGRELAAQIATDVLIIEDEALIALDLEALVQKLGHNVVGIARTRAEAIKVAESRSPGLILADIQLADGSSGLDAVNDILNSFSVPVFTAYPERYLTGERPEPAFLVSKPYQPSAVSALISQALFFERNAVHRKGL